MKLSLETVASFTGRGFIDVHDVVAESPAHAADDEPTSRPSGMLSSRPPPVQMPRASTPSAPASSSEENEEPLTTPILPRSGSPSRPHKPDEIEMPGDPLDGFGDMGFVKTV